MTFRPEAELGNKCLRHMLALEGTTWMAEMYVHELTWLKSFRDVADVDVLQDFFNQAGCISQTSTGSFPLGRKRYIACKPSQLHVLACDVRHGKKLISALC